MKKLLFVAMAIVLGFLALAAFEPRLANELINTIARALGGLSDWLQGR